MKNYLLGLSILFMNTSFCQYRHVSFNTPCVPKAEPKDADEWAMKLVNSVQNPADFSLNSVATNKQIALHKYATEALEELLRTTVNSTKSYPTALPTAAIIQRIEQLTELSGCLDANPSILADLGNLAISDAIRAHYKEIVQFLIFRNACSANVIAIALKNHLDKAHDFDFKMALVYVPGLKQHLENSRRCTISNKEQLLESITKCIGKDGSIFHFCSISEELQDQLKELHLLLKKQF